MTCPLVVIRIMTTTACAKLSLEFRSLRSHQRSHLLSNIPWVESDHQEQQQRTSKHKFVEKTQPRNSRKKRGHFLVCARSSAALDLRNGRRPREIYQHHLLSPKRRRLYNISFEHVLPCTAYSVLFLEHVVSSILSTGNPVQYNKV
jgi:hypothetical protein